MNLVTQIQAVGVRVKSWWFDLRRAVSTSANKNDAGSPNGRNYSYLPTRPSTARRMLRNLLLQCYSDYTFIDFGSKKAGCCYLRRNYPSGRSSDLSEY